MGFALSAVELTQLRAAVKTLLSPLDFESIGAWRTEARRTIGALIRADSSVSFLPLAGEAPFQSDRLPALAEYAEHYHTIDPTTDYRKIGTEAFNWQTWRARCERPSRESWVRSELYNDWVRKQQLCQPCGLTVVRSPDELPCPGFPKFSGVTGLWFYWGHDEPSESGDRELAILQTLLPAFEAGIQILLRTGGMRNVLANIVEHIAEGIALYDGAGRVAYESSVFRRLLCDEPQALRIESECRQLARSLLLHAAQHPRKSWSRDTTLATTREIKATSTHYRVTGTFVNASPVGSGPAAIIVLERVTPLPLSPADLCDRYHLTGREAT